MTSAKSLTAPVDLELHVRTISTSDGLALSYTLNSPSGVLPNCFHRDAGIRHIGSDPVFRRHMEAIHHQIDHLMSGLGMGSEVLLNEDIEAEMTTIGQQLYESLFSEELRIAYAAFREEVTSWLIVSDDRWSIPWELICPFELAFDDEPLCLKFRLARWSRGSMEPPGEIRVSRLTSLGPGPRLESLESSSAHREHQILKRFGGAETDIFAEVTHRQLRKILSRKGYGLFHYAGHGAYLSAQPSESSIALADRPFRARELTGPLQLTLRAGRPLVFLNACRVSRKGWWLTGLGGWGERWTKSCGCGAFIGPQWTVRDDAAQRYAEVFYEELTHQTFGEALRQARIRVRQEFPGNLTWAAYTGYFHPNGRLVRTRNQWPVSRRSESSSWVPTTS